MYYIIFSENISNSNIYKQYIVKLTTLKAIRQPLKEFRNTLTDKD
jgi:hypothetical protein